MKQIYEAHVTIEPVEDAAFDMFDAMCRAYRFRPAHLLMMKDRRWTEQRSNRDSFCTGHGEVFVDIEARTIGLVRDLKAAGFAVWRYKIELMVVDVRTPPLVQIAA